MERAGGVIFDFNGTLFEDTDKHVRAWRLMVREVFARELTETEFQVRFAGRDNRLLIEYLSGGPVSPARAEALSEGKEALYRRLCLESPADFRLAPGAPELLDELARRGIPRAIATSAGKSNMDFYVERFGLDRWFSPEAIVYDDGSMPCKPDPTVYRLAAQRIAVPAERCVAVEDSLAGIQAAHAAGIGKIIAIAPEGRREALLGMPEVYGVIPDFYALDRGILEWTGRHG
jgi:HAD superfamily hydrolase (TIGR01509 family)